LRQRYDASLIFEDTAKANDRSPNHVDLNQMMRHFWVDALENYEPGADCGIRGEAAIDSERKRPAFRSKAAGDSERKRPRY
jgi:hypothetical protein